MTKLTPEWIRTSNPVIRSPACYRWTTAPALELEGIVVNNRTLSDMENIISEKMSTQVSELKRLRKTIDQPYKFKKRWNEEQHNINHKVLSMLKDTEESVAPLMK